MPASDGVSHLTPTLSAPSGGEGDLQYADRAGPNAGRAGNTREEERSIRNPVGAIVRPQVTMPSLGEGRNALRGWARKR